jgi:hypothetical protein
MLPERTIDCFLADRAGTRCLFKLRNIAKVKKLQEKINNIW